MRDYHEFIDKTLIQTDQLQNRIIELGAEITRDYTGRNLVLVCILRGGVVFMVDLMRHIHVPHSIDFMSISSYGVGAFESSGTVRISLDLKSDIRDRDVLVVEDIVDSGNTIASVLDLLSTRKPASLYVCALLDKAERREVVVPIRYTGFVIPNEFVFGYGLDIDEYYRNLPFVATVDLQKYQGIV
jgi:hypoxanthine phosphoribosyltransferase